MFGGDEGGQHCQSGLFANRGGQDTAYFLCVRADRYLSEDGWAFVRVITYDCALSLIIF